MFPYFSATHGGLSRIDFGLCNTAMLPLVISSMKIDYSPFWVELLVPNVPRKVGWKLNPFWLSLIPELNPVPGLLDTFFNCNLGTAGLGTVEYS